MAKSNPDTFGKMLKAESRAIEALRDVRVVYQSIDRTRVEIEQSLDRLVRFSKSSRPLFEEYWQ